MRTTGFVGNAVERQSEDILPVLGLADVDECLQLLLHDSLSLAALTLLKSLANTENDANTNVQGRAGLLGYKSRIFMEETTTLGVAYIGTNDIVS